MEAHKDKCLTFALSNEFFGIPIQNVKEIIGMIETTVIPKTPKFIKGVINLRGKIIPIIDLRLRFGLDEKAYTERTCIIVTEISVRDSKRQIGMVVDTVLEVVTIQKEKIEPPPQYGQHINDFLIGMINIKEKVVLLISVEKIMLPEEIMVSRELKTVSVEA